MVSDKSNVIDLRFFSRRMQEVRQRRGESPELVDN